MKLRSWIVQNKLISFIILFLFVDSLVLLLHSLFPEKTFFNLDVESNLPTIYQGMKVLLVSFFAFYLFLSTDGKFKYFWIFFAFVFLFLALDEVGQIHENLPTFFNELFIKEGQRNLQDVVSEFGYESTTWLPYYIIPFLIFFVVVGVFLMKFIKKNWKRAMLLMIGLIFLVLGLVIEFVSTKPNIMFQEGYGTLVFWEEAFEILAISFILFFVYTYFSDMVAKIKKLQKDS
ncbi:MAG: hypothetical protein ACOX0R_02970 [Candidatus Dojkabacteria bacterium]|jgi:hypothetical protein